MKRSNNALVVLGVLLALVGGYRLVVPVFGAQVTVPAADSQPAGHSIPTATLIGGGVLLVGLIVVGMALISRRLDL